MSSNGKTTTGSSRTPRGSAVYEEMAKEIPDQTLFTSNEISQGSFDDDDGLEMVPVTLALGQANTFDDEHFNDERPSNERLLLTAFFTFTVFTTFQTIAAFVAGSEAMMGDSGAMLVDALTYLFNLVAERRKSRFEEYYQELQRDQPCDDPRRRAKLKKRAKRKMILRMELIPPVISVTTLLCVTAVVLHGSLRMLLLDAHRDRSEQGDPNVTLMLVFSCMNLVLDVVNVFCFARANRLCGYATTPKHIVPGSAESSVASPRRAPKHYAQLGDSSEAADGGLDTDIEDMTFEDRFQAIKEKLAEIPQGMEEFQDEPEHDFSSDTTVTSSNARRINGHTHGKEKPHEDEEDDDDDDDEIQEEANLNMCSAYTVRTLPHLGFCQLDMSIYAHSLFVAQHVFADTLRSIAVIVAATVAELADGVTSEEADATAAVVVSVLILLSLLPLLSGLLSTFGELRSIHAEERDERIAEEQQSSIVT